MHYAPSGVGSLTPTLRLRCRSGVFHRRAAPPCRPIRARPSSWSSFPQLYALQAVRLSRVGRQPTLRLAVLPEVRGIRFVIPYMFSGRGLGLPPRRFWFSTFISHCTYVIYASSSSLSSGTAWWTPGGDNGQDQVHHRQGVPYRQSRSPTTSTSWRVGASFFS